MKAHLVYLLLRVRESFWFLPILMMLAAVALSHGALSTDRETALGALAARLWFGALDEASARQILATVTGAMITTASLVFSLTLVSLTLASQQLGPRLLSMFLRDRMTQTVLGLFLATFVYALIVLMALGGEDGPVLVPMLSITLAVLSTIASFVALIMFIHHLSTSLQADVVVARVAAQLKQQIDESLPIEAPRGGGAATAQKEPDIAGRTIHSSGCGYVQAIDHEALLALASEHDLKMQILRGPGQFVCEGEPIALVSPESSNPEEYRGRLQQAIVFGEKRTSTQDLGFALMAIVEIALRALSPGINDPHTANTCVDRLGEALLLVFLREIPPHASHDDAGTLRVLQVPVTVDGLLDTAFNEIRQHAAGNVSVLIRLTEALERLARCASTAQQQAAVERHLRMLERRVENDVTEAEDRDSAHEVVARVRRALDAGTPAS